MTNKYSELSDSEIEHLIAEVRNGRVIDRINRDVFVSKICSRYEDAFRVMIDNKLDLDFNPLTNSWSCRKRTNKNYISSLNENPCRAIAECFLLIKDEGNG